MQAQGIVRGHCHRSTVRIAILLMCGLLLFAKLTLAQANPAPELTRPVNPPVSIRPKVVAKANTLVLAKPDHSDCNAPRIDLSDDDHDRDGGHDDDDDDDHHDNCYNELRPRMQDGTLAPLVITARTRINRHAPLIPDASGEPGKVHRNDGRLGVRRASCSGGDSISGKGSDRDEELIFTFDAPLPTGALVLGLAKIDFDHDAPVLFVASAGSTSFDFVIPTSELESAFDHTGSDRGVISFGVLPSIPPSTLVRAFKIRETDSGFLVDRLELGSACDDGDPCTEDICKEGGCAHPPASTGTPCGDPASTSCSAPDTCDSSGLCVKNDAPDGQLCSDGLGCNAVETCQAGQCGPDVCGQFVGGCQGNDWSCGSNWAFGGNYPDNGTVTYSVLLDGDDDVFLDVDVEIDSLEVLDQARLLITQEGQIGNLTIATAAGLLLEATIQVSNGRTLFVPVGNVILRNGGLFESLPARALAPGSGGVSAAGVTIAPGGAMLLTGTMQAIINGDLELDGADADPCDQGGRRGGIVPPPKFGSSDTSESDVFGELDLEGSVEFFHSSSVPLDLGGSFTNHCTTPQCFDWSLGGLRLVPIVPTPAGGQDFEVGGRDIGALPEGFLIEGDTNFSIGSLEVQSNRFVRFQNTFANTVGTTPCSEALYVRDLILRTGSSIEFNNARIYYENKTEEPGVTINRIGCGGLQRINPCGNGLACADGDICTLDGCPTPVDCTHTPIPFLAFGDADLSGIVELGDVVCALLAYAGNFTVCPRERTDVFPCEAPDGLVELGDILGFLQAYSGTPPCPNPCP